MELLDTLCTSVLLTQSAYCWQSETTDSGPNSVIVAGVCVAGVRVAGVEYA